MKPAILLFGEAEKGEFGTPLFCQSLIDLSDMLGNPPEESQGIPYAIQTLLYSKGLFFCRVQEEGFSTKDYMKGLKALKNESKLSQLQAIAIPGVGDEEIVEAALDVCHLYKTLLVLTEKDLYDYIMDSRPFS